MAPCRELKGLATEDKFGHSTLALTGKRKGKGKMNEESEVKTDKADDRKEEPKVAAEENDLKLKPYMTGEGLV